MNPACPRKPTHLDDDALVAQTAAVNTAHQLSLTLLLEHLAEVDVRRLFAKRGHSSMHRFCVRELNMSDDAAYARIRVARLGRRLPAVLTWLADGRLHLTAARLLASHLTPENHRAVLAEASGLNVAGIKQLVARLAPKPDVPTRVRALPAPRHAPPPTSGQEAMLRSVYDTLRAPNASPAVDGPRSPSVGPLVPEGPRPQVAPPLTLDGPRSPSVGPPVPEGPRPQVAPPLTLDGPRSPSAGPPSPEGPRTQVAPPLTLEAPRPIVAPLAPERFEVRFTASAELIEKLTEVTALLSHAVPDGDLPTVLERALDLARIQLVKRRFGAGAAADRAGAPGAAPADAPPGTDERVGGQSKGRAKTTPRSAEARPRVTSPEKEPAGPASASRSATRRDGEARPRAASPAEPASASRSATRRDGEAHPRVASPAEAPARPAAASRSATWRDAEARPRATSPAEQPTGPPSAASRPCPSTESRCEGRATEVVSKPAPTHETPVRRSRYIPAAVRAEVWRRDEGRCTYVDPDTGHVCGERRFLELHHIQAFARGGQHSVEGLTLRCRAHNAWAARVDFGAEHMAAFARRDGL